MTESDLYVKIRYSATTKNFWRWKITVCDRNKISYYSDGILKEFNTDVPIGRTIANWKAKRMLRKARQYKANPGKEWTIE